MPELPEVETIRRGLEPRVIGQTITSVLLHWPKFWQGDLNLVEGQRVVAVRRLAKVLLIDLENLQTIMIHLKMTGQLVHLNTVGQAAVGGHPDTNYRQPLPHKHTHLEYRFADGGVLYANDLRKFGWHKLVPTEQVEAKIGPSLAGVDASTEALTAQKLAELLAKRPKAPIKQLLLDQSLISGLGNIYVAESLYRAKILPTRLAHTLKPTEIEVLAQAVRQILAEAIDAGGTSFNDYLNVEGQQGSFLERAAVYQQERCPLGHPILKIKQGGRTTHYCAICQQ